MTEQERLRQFELRAHQAEERLEAVRNAIEAQAQWHDRQGAYPALMHDLLDIIDRDPQTGRLDRLTPERVGGS